MSYTSFQNNNTGATQFALLQFRKSNDFLSVGANDSLARILSSGYDAVTQTFKLAAYIECLATGAPSTNVPSQLQFVTTNGTSNHLAMTVGENGQVNIANPATNQATLVVRNDQSTPNINLRTANATPTNAPHIHFTRSGAGTADVVANDELGRLEYFGFQGGSAREAGEITAVAESVNGTTGVSSYLSFRTVPTSYAASAERMRISGNGFVSVNIPAAAGSALTVNGVNSNANYSLISQAAVTGGIHNAARLWNYSGTAGSATQVSIDVFNQLATTGGDPSLRFLNIGIRAITLGIDSSTDQFAIANSSALGSSNFLTWTASNNQINLPLQCCFHAWISTAQNNVTGAGTYYDVIFQTERYDVSSSYNATTGVFTAPATGKYLFTSQIEYTGITAAMTWGEMGFQVNAATIVGGLSYINVGAAAVIGTFISLQNTCLMSLTAGDTVRVRTRIQNGAGDTADLAVSTSSFFAGQLLS